MKQQKGIWIPETETWNQWGKGFEKAEYNKLKLSGNLAIDIGAHVGIWSQRLSKDFQNVICFEPLFKHIECHVRNCTDLNNIRLITCALSNTESTLPMTTKNSNSGQSSLVAEMFPRTKNRRVVNVNTKTLDSFNFPKIDFIKIDVEGWEKQVLLGARKTIDKYRPKMYIEIWDKNYDTINELMNSWGYSLEKYKKTKNYLATG